MGAWIEICIPLRERYGTEVAPFVGAWIEIPAKDSRYQMNVSLPSWERGLKFGKTIQNNAKAAVAPFVGAWIEIGRVYDKT